MPTSRSALEFMRRCGIDETPRLKQPRLNMGRMKVDTIPLCRDQLNPDLMLDANGSPAPDRGIADRWPPPQEVCGNGLETGGDPE